MTIPEKAWKVDDGEYIFVVHGPSRKDAEAQYRSEYGLATWEDVTLDVTRCAAMDGLAATNYHVLALGVVGNAEECCPGCGATIAATDVGNERRLWAYDSLDGERPLVDGDGDLWCSESCWKGGYR